MAAVLACGPGAVVSHRSAASLWRLLPERPGAEVDISVPGAGGKKKRRGIRIHRRVALTPENVTRHRGIPVTNPACTIIDLRAVATPAETRQAIRQAAVLGLSIGPAGRDGSPTPDGTRSELEYRFLRLCKQHRLPTPEVNVRIGSLLVDFVWPDRKLVVETDGYRYHRGRQAFEDDRARDLRLRSQGYEVIRLTYEQVTKQPEATAGVLRKVLSRHVTT